MSEARRAMNLYRQLLGKQWNDVHPKVRASHLDGTVLDAHCSLDVTGSTNFLGRLICRIVFFPRPQISAPVELHITSAPEGELWERKFPDRNLRSVQFVSSDGYLVDRFRLIAFYFRLTPEHGGILHNHERTYLHVRNLILRVPRFLSPKIMSHEEPDINEEASRITVGVHMPLIGNILTYRGIVRPVKATP